MKRNYVCLAVLICALGFKPAWSQTVSVQVEGKVTDAGKPLAGVSLALTNLGTARVYKVKTDKSGAFAMVGVPQGDYEVEISDASGEKLFKKKTSVVASGGGAVNLDIDVSQKSGAAQPPSLTPEQLEELKKQREKAINMNALIQQANTALTNKNWQDAIAPLQQLIAAQPDNWQYYSGLGDAQLNLGQYEDAVATYEKGVQVVESNTTVDPKNPATDPARKKVGEAKMLTNEGNALLKLKKNQEAVEAYTKAASLDPNPGTAYFNLCATQYNTGNTEGALAACDKAIAADPNKADAYFIKGSLLIAGSKTDKDGNVIAPPGTAEALNKYLQLQPDGAHAEDVKQMLQYIGSKVETTYKKKGK